MRPRRRKTPEPRRAKADPRVVGQRAALTRRANDPPAPVTLPEVRWLGRGVPRDDSS